MKKLTTISLGIVFMLGSLASGQAQSLLASSTISGTPDSGSPGSYDYTLILNALSGSVPIESFWFAWTPGNFYLGSTPTSIIAGDGWSGSAAGDSIQFSEGSLGTPITAGTSDTFTFVNTDTPAEMATEVGPLHSVAYSGGILSSPPNETIGVQAVPEPSVFSLLAIGFGVVGGSIFRRKRGQGSC